jgi:translation elongation factor EF-G
VTNAPFPPLHVRISPANEIARAELREALGQMPAADPRFAVVTRPDGDHDLHGISEAHIEEKLQLLRHVYAIAFEVRGSYRRLSAVPPADES